MANCGIFTQQMAQSWFEHGRPETEGFALSVSLALAPNLGLDQAELEQVDQDPVTAPCGPLNSDRVVNVAEIAAFVADVK